MGKVLFDHIALALPRIAEAAPVLAGRLGGVPDFGARGRGYTFGQWRFAGGGRIEVLEPRGPEAFLHRFLAERGRGVHHVTFKVPHLGEACDRARTLGYEIVGFDDANPRWQEAFLHPRQALGIVVQLAASDPTLPAGEPSGWDPPQVPDPPPAVTMLGLRMRVRSAARARTQWQGVLLGEESADPAGTLVYRWPGSPLRISVALDPGATEGPVAIEVAGDRLAAPPPDVVAALGTELLLVAPE